MPRFSVNIRKQTSNAELAAEHQQRRRKSSAVMEVASDLGTLNATRQNSLTPAAARIVSVAQWELVNSWVKRLAKVIPAAAHDGQEDGVGNLPAASDEGLQGNASQQGSDQAPKKQAQIEPEAACSSIGSVDAQFFRQKLLDIEVLEVFAIARKQLTFISVGS